MGYQALIQVGQLFLIVVLGFFLRTVGYASEDDARKLIKITTASFLPALIFKVIYTSNFPGGAVAIPFLALGLMLFLLGISFIVVKLLGIKDKKVYLPFVVAASAGNTGYLGYPVTLSLFGDKGLALAVVYDIFATVIFALAIATPLIASASGKSLSPKELFISTIKFIPLHAAILGFLLKPVSLPVVIVDTVSFMGDAAIPLILLAIGLSLRPMVKKTYLQIAVIAVVIKLVVSPLVMSEVSKLFISGLEWKIAVIEASMPSMTLTYVLSERYNADFRLASFLVIFTTGLSIITIPVVSYLIS